MNEQEFIEMQRRAQLETTVKLYFVWLQDVSGCPVEKEIVDIVDYDVYKAKKDNN